MSVWPFCCSVSPPGGRCRTTAAQLPVFWGVRPAAVVSRGTWTMLLFLTFLMWVALHVQEAAAVMWAEFLLGFCLVPSFTCTSFCKECWLHSVLCQSLICVLTLMTTSLSCDTSVIHVCGVLLILMICRWMHGCVRLIFGWRFYFLKEFCFLLY